MTDQPKHSLSDVLDGTVDPAVLAHLAAGHPIYYFDDELDSIVEERPDGTMWRFELGPGRSVRYIDDGPAWRNSSSQP
tara:strand:+ start:2583 stop:2816 length:234 start_codon:yes stop_codon:yes gene_type:complete